MERFETQEQVAQAIIDNDSLIWWTIKRFPPTATNTIADEDDLHQRCVEHLLNNLHQFDPDKGAFATYFVVICKTAIRNESVDGTWEKYRYQNDGLIDGRHSSPMSTFITEDGNDFGDDVILEDMTADVFESVDDRLWIENLPEDERKMMLMLAMGYTFGEIGAVMGLQPKAKWNGTQARYVSPARQVQLLLADIMRDRNPELRDVEIAENAHMQSNMATPKSARERTCFKEGYCWYGHEYTEDNTLWQKGKKRKDGSYGPDRKRCKQCIVDQKAARKVADQQLAEENSVPFSEATHRKLHNLVRGWLIKLGFWKS